MVLVRSGTDGVLLALVLVGLASSSSLGTAVEYGNANYYVDLVIYNVNTLLPE